MTKIDTSTEAVERLLEDVTPGPWTVEYRDGTICLIMGDNCEMCNETYYPWVPSNHYDWHFFVAARDLVPALLKERDDLRAKLDAAVSIADSALNAVTEVQDYKQPDDPWTENALTRQELDIFDFDVSTARATLAKIKGATHE